MNNEQKIPQFPFDRVFVSHHCIFWLKRHLMLLMMFSHELFASIYPHNLQFGMKDYNFQYLINEVSLHIFEVEIVIVRYLCLLK